MSETTLETAAEWQERTAAELVRLLATSPTPEQVAAWQARSAEEWGRVAITEPPPIEPAGEVDDWLRRAAAERDRVVAEVQLAMLNNIPAEELP